ncbi:MAG: FAD-dependent oxidoreductase [Candidatus Absconditabacterales bacterium]|nr:FAD-dependent oxidoreductase [Candidatus Absconditabacterales bacterium]
MLIDCCAYIRDCQYSGDGESVRVTLVCDRVIDFLPGQFVFVTIPHRVRANGKPLSNPYSIASLPSQMISDQTLTLGIKREGEGGVSDRFVRMAAIGDEVHLRMPLGHFGLQSSRPAVFLATGSGLAPIRALYHAHPQKSDSYFLYGERTQDALYPFLRSFFEDNPTKKKRLCLSREVGDGPWWSQGRISDFLDALDVTSETERYVCGSRPVVQSLKNLIVQRGGSHILTEAW